MGDLIVATHMSVDGVVESPHPDNWLVLEGDHAPEAHEWLSAADALVLGRKTYEGLAAVWPSMTDESGYAERINGLPKHVASTTLAEPLEWNASLIRGDLAEEVALLKKSTPGDLLVVGCGTLAAHLVALGLVDEVRILVYPTVWGEGERIFHGARVPLTRVATTPFMSGVSLQCYRPVVAG